MKCGNCEHFDDASGGKCAVWAKGIPADARAVMPEWAIDELSVCSGDAFSWRGSDCSLFERRQGFMKLHRQVQP